MSYFTIVIVNDVGLILLRRGLLSSVNVYRASVHTIRGAVVVTLLLIVRSVDLGRTALALALLFAYVLPIVDPNSYSDILVKRVWSIDLIQLVLNLFLKALVESLYKALLAILNSK